MYLDDYNDDNLIAIEHLKELIYVSGLIEKGLKDIEIKKANEFIDEFLINMRDK